MAGTGKDTTSIPDLFPATPPAYRQCLRSPGLGHRGSCAAGVKHQSVRRTGIDGWHERYGC